MAAGGKKVLGVGPRWVHSTEWEISVGEGLEMKGSTLARKLVSYLNFVYTFPVFLLSKIFIVLKDFKQLRKVRYRKTFPSIPRHELICQQQPPLICSLVITTALWFC